MRNLKRIVLALVIGAFTLTSCEKEPLDITNTTNITNNESHSTIDNYKEGDVLVMFFVPKGEQVSADLYYNSLDSLVTGLQPISSNDVDYPNETVFVYLIKKDTKITMYLSNTNDALIMSASVVTRKVYSSKYSITNVVKGEALTLVTLNADNYTYNNNIDLDVLKGYSEIDVLSAPEPCLVNLTYTPTILTDVED